MSLLLLFSFGADSDATFTIIGPLQALGERVVCSAPEARVIMSEPRARVTFSDPDED